MNPAESMVTFSNRFYSDKRFIKVYTNTILSGVEQSFLGQVPLDGTLARTQARLPLRYTFSKFPHTSRTAVQSSLVDYGNQYIIIIKQFPIRRSHLRLIVTSVDESVSKEDGPMTPRNVSNVF
jgi:hypothetical protein